MQNRLLSLCLICSYILPTRKMFYFYNLQALSPPPPSWSRKFLTLQTLSTISSLKPAISHNYWHHVGGFNLSTPPFSSSFIPQLQMDNEYPPLLFFLKSRVWSCLLAIYSPRVCFLNRHETPGAILLTHIRTGRGGSSQQVHQLHPKICARYTGAALILIAVIAIQQQRGNRGKVQTHTHERRDEA